VVKEGQGTIATSDREGVRVKLAGYDHLLVRRQIMAPERVAKDER
jgi:hypothetical protein